MINFEEKEELSILISGDFCPHKRVEKLFLNKKFSEVYNGFEELSKNFDLVITNLECPLTNHNIKLKKTGPNIKVDPRVIDGIKYGGFNFITLANNHIKDYGKIGILDTLNILDENKISHIGAGINLEEAKKVSYIKLKSGVISIINIAENEWASATENSAGANPQDIINNYYQIKKAKQNSDFLIMIIHGGNEFYSFPSPERVKTYRFFADMGANLIISHHTHFFSGYEIYKNVPIFYGLGNFLFDWQNKPIEWYKGFFLTFSINFKNKEILTNLQIHPYLQLLNELKLRLLNKQKKNQFINEIKELSLKIENHTFIKNSFEKYTKERELSYIEILFSLNKLQRKIAKMLGKNTFFIKEKQLLRLFNSLRCESHKEVILNILERLLNRR